ncbi:ABC transporter permease [Dechloromonas denitrificans]|uniref:ABC transporter permease n=1 Tax=Dechloromonas denitrificans TaxID=281362 RepID=UPI001CF85C30|nr:FtsX-like permease family protein [Dechloromonas denitrificans]UCV01916.1 ABC transporter permease [Dechloromonas denitrificans]UCV06250.1 ABC transporter permease [Dechloromonas denitrificans]
MISLMSDIRIATRNLRRNTKRTLVAVLTVSGGVIAFLLAGGFIDWTLLNMREDTIHSQLGHIQIVRPNYFEKGIADPYRFLLPSNAQEQSIVATTPGLRTLSSRLAFSGLLSLDEGTVPFIGEGIDPELERPISSRINIIAGQDLRDRKERAILLGEGLAKSIGAKTGDTVVLLATTANGSANAVEVVVAGVFSTSSKEFDDNALRLPLDIAHKLMRVDGATSWVVLLDDTSKTKSAVDYLSASLPPGKFEIVPWDNLADFYNKTAVLFSRQVEVVKLIIGLIVILTISNTQTMSVLERTTEIGTSLAIGLRNRVILQIFLLEGVLIGLAGGILGIGLGYLLATLISAVGIPMPAPPGMAHGYTGEILISIPIALDAIALALTTTLLASIMPAWRASRMNIVDALRCNQ